MDDLADFKGRLKWLRDRSKLPSKRQAAAAYGMDYETYKKIEAPNSGRSLTVDQAERIARYHKVSAGWLLFGEGTAEGEFSVPLVGCIRAGQEMVIYDDMGQDSGVADASIGEPGARAFDVRGDSMMPLAHDGDVIFVSADRRDLRRLVGNECAVLLQDGRRLFKILERGSTDSRYDLRSYNAETIRDVEVHSAGRFLGLKRKR